MSASACDCTGECEEMLPREHCILFIARSAVVDLLHCQTCGAYTWHKDEKCIRCEAIKTGELKV